MTELRGMAVLQYGLKINSTNVAVQLKGGDTGVNPVKRLDEYKYFRLISWTRINCEGG